MSAAAASRSALRLPARSAYPCLVTAADRLRSRALLDELGRYVVAEPWPFAVDLARSRGMWLATVDGDLLHDWGGLYGSRLIGYNHPRLLEPAYQARLALAANNKMANPDFLTSECLDYYRLMHRLAPRVLRGPRMEVYAVNSGAEAVENAIKYLINLHDAKRAARGLPPGRRRLVWFDRAFHGRTLLTLNLTELPGSPAATRGFHGLIADTVRVPFPAWDREASAGSNEETARRSLAAVRAALEESPGEVVAVIAEPLQSAGGQRVAVPGFLARLSALVHEHDTFLMFDEVQTAGGPCGDIFLADLLDLPHPPQAIATAKKLGCGVVFMRESMQDVGVLDSTWGGNLADMVRVVQEFAVVEEEGLLARLPAKARQLEDGLLALRARHAGLLRNVRGHGLYQGFSFTRPELRAQFIALALEQHGTFLLGAGDDSLRLRPPLDVTAQDITRLLGVMDEVLHTLAAAGG